MKLPIKTIWILSVLINLSAVIWYIIGSTAIFQRKLDLVSTFIMVFFGVSSVVLIIVSTILIRKSWNPTSTLHFILLTIIILCMITMSSILFKSVNLHGWLYDNVTSDTLKVTDDNQYEYQIELINVFQKNSDIRLYIKENSSGEEFRIALNRSLYKNKSFSVGDTNNWIKMSSTFEKEIYTVETTVEAPIPTLKFTVDFKKRELLSIN